MKKQILLLTMVVMFCPGARTVYSQGGCWVKKKNMSVEKCLMPTAVVNGIIYAIGGSSGAYTSTSDVEAYDAATDSWAPKANLPQILCGETARTVNDKIYVIGGSTSVLGDGYVVDNVYEYNPVSNSWTRNSNIPIPIAYAAADVVDGKIYVIGGAPFGFSSAYKSVYEYNPATDTWTKKTDMPTARFVASATAVDGKIYVFGGAANATLTGLSAVEVYDPSADTWAVKGPMPIPRAGHASSAAGGNIYLFTGGTGYTNLYKDVLEYNPTLDTWATKTSIPTSRYAPAACSVGGKIYIIGGMDEDNTRLSIVEEYNPALDVTSVSERNKGSSPVEYSLSQNYPNPFNPTTSIQYSVPSTQYVSLMVYNVLGKEAALLVSDTKQPGTYAVTWDASGLSSGVYFYRLTAGKHVETKKMILLR
jgi:N-acetylneuraminic acid mutarotase